MKFSTNVHLDKSYKITHRSVNLLNIVLFIHRMIFWGKLLRFRAEMRHLAWITVSVSMQSGTMDEAVADFVGREGLTHRTPFIQTADSSSSNTVVDVAVRSMQLFLNSCQRRLVRVLRFRYLIIWQCGHVCV